MNKIQQLFSQITDEELRQAIKEIEEDNLKGFIRDGVLRKYTKLMTEITGGNNANDLMMAEINLLRQAAIRWCAIEWKNLTYSHE